jgi:hypothetical protein
VQRASILHEAAGNWDTRTITHSCYKHTTGTRHHGKTGKRGGRSTDPGQLLRSFKFAVHFYIFYVLIFLILASYFSEIHAYN